MLKSMRSAVFIKAMMWIVCVSFIGLIVLEWGADLSGRKAGRVDVGKVNGQTISYQSFKNLIDQASRQQKDQTGQEPDFGALVDATWNRVVGETLLEEEIQKRGIVVSSAEVDYFNRHQPVEAVRSQPVFQTDGKFDPAKYNQWLDDPATFKNAGAAGFVRAVEGSIEGFLRKQKLQERIVAAVKVTDAETRQAYIEQREQIKVQYAVLDASAVPDTEVPVTDAEISAYYQAHQKDFEQGGAVRCDGVVFGKQTTPEDERASEAEVRRLLGRARAGEDFAKLAQDNSDDTGSAQQGGDLGFFGKGRMVPAFEQAAFALQPGQISDPIRSPFGWHIIKLEERKTENGQEQVRARHILRKIEKSRESIDRLRDQAEMFLEQARKKGFSSAAAAAGLQTHDTQFFSGGAFLPGLGNHTSGLVALFLQKSEGEVSPLFEDDRGLFIYALKAKRKAGVRPLEEVRQRITTLLQQEKKVALAGRRLEPVASAVRSGTSIEDAARANGATTDTTGLCSRQLIPKIGGQNAFSTAAFALTAPGQTSGVVVTDRAAYVIRLLERKPVEEKGFETEKGTIKGTLATRKRDQAFSAWFEDLRKNASIVDHRYLFFPEY